MTSPATSPLRYVLSSTALTVETALRLAVVSDDRGGHLVPEVVVGLSSPSRALPVTSRALVPVAESAQAPAWTVAGNLRAAFDAAHPRTAALAADLSARAEQFLAGLRMGEEPTEVVAIGQALEVVHRELAAADRMRREWVAGQGRDVRVTTWDLTADDLVQVEGTPRALPPDVALPTAAATALAQEYGVIVAVTSSDPDVAVSEAAVVVYRRPPAALPDGATAVADARWRRDDVFSHLHLIDVAGLLPGHSVPAPRSALPAGQHQGIQAQLSAQSPAVAEGQYGAHRQHGLHLDPAEAAVVSARIQLELLQGSDEYARLAATHHRAEELAALEHEARLADGRTRRA